MDLKVGLNWYNYHTFLFVFVCYQHWGKQGDTQNDQ